MTMAATSLTRERIQELRRIAEAATPGPWIKDTENRYAVRCHWDQPKNGLIGYRVCVVSGNGPQHESDWDYIAAFNPATALALLDRVEQLEADNNKLERENGELYRRIERLEAKLARQRVVLRRLQVAVERRNSQERIDALRRKLSDEKRLLDRIEALERRDSEVTRLILDAITWLYDEDANSVAVDESDRKRGLERLRQALLLLDPAAAARFPQFWRW